ncbi:MAG: hypothetical protein IBJ10_08600 [Phycisphaerales bacterium]|nr:hypothetical protein [Phycisphaerales bacterium]
MRIDGPSNPYRITQAYGLAPQTPVARPAPVAATTTLQRAEAVSRSDTVATIGMAQQPGAVSATARLVAAVVPGAVDFSAATPMPSKAALQMYRHPADRHSAATLVALGRSLDING